jgi:hypothetical protein
MQVVEAAKARQPAACLQAFQRLYETDDAGAQLNGLTLARHVIRRHWTALPEDQQLQVVQYVHGIISRPQGRETAPSVKAQLASIAADVAVQAGEECTNHTLHTIVVSLMQAGAIPRSQHAQHSDISHR